MYFLSDAYRLRDAIIAERAEERAKAVSKAAAAPVAKFAAPAKTGRRAMRFSLTAFGFPLVAPFGRTK